MATQTASYPQRQSNTNGGRLYLVATPIGNLEDITLRALRVLKEADVIACEDTRQTAKLLNHYGIHKRAVSYHEHNEVMKAPELVLEMEEGMRVALVSDAGTPGISDPGHHLVSLAIRHGVPVVPVPGPSAFAASLAASGLPTDHFHFIGFLPARRTQRRKMLKALSDDPGTFVFYEAPHRLAASLADMLALLGNRQVVIAREVTKVHEEFLRGRLKDLAAWAKRRRVKGEITIMVAPHDTESLAQPTRRRSSLCARVDEIRTERGLDLRGALKIVAHELGISRSEAYRRLQEEKALQ